MGLVEKGAYWNKDLGGEGMGTYQFQEKSIEIEGIANASTYGCIWCV